MDIIQVTEDDIQNGHKRDPGNCMVYRAVARYYGNCHGVTSGQFYAPLGCVKMDKAVRKRIRQFDLDKPVKPFAIVVEWKHKKLGLNQTLSVGKARVMHPELVEAALVDG